MQNMAHLIQDLTSFLRSSLAPSTSSTYRTTWNSYQNFCLHANVRPYPLNQVVLLFYIASLANTKVYLSAVQYCSNVLGYEISMARMYTVFYLLCGIRRQQDSQYRLPRQHPITLLHLQQLFNFVSCNISNVHNKCMLRSILTLVFFGMLRYSEYTSPTISSYFLESTLQLKYISFSLNQQLAIITIKQ